MNKSKRVSGLSGTILRPAADGECFLGEAPQGRFEESWSSGPTVRSTAVDGERGGAK
jgi:hypothetical protein